MKESLLKDIIIMKNALALSLALVAMSSVTQSAQAAVLIQVDISNPSAVTFTSTDAFASINDSTSTMFDGVTFDEIFSASSLVSETYAGLTGSGLFPPTTTGLAYDDTLTAGDGVSTTDLNFYANTGSPTQSFSTGAPAFSGSATVNIAGVTYQSVGYIGEILAGYADGGSFDSIGQYQIVPEPGSLALLGPGGLLITRRRRA